MDEITLILTVASLVLFLVTHFVTEKKPIQMFGGVLGVCTIAALLQDTDVNGTLLYLMLLVMAYVTLMSLAGAIVRIGDADA